MTLAAAQADIVNIPVNSTTYVRSPDGSALADEYMNVAGTLTATGRRMPSQQSVDESHKNILGYLTDALPNLYRFKTVHCQTAPTAQASSVAASWFILPDALTAGLISKVELAVATAGKIYVATFSKAGNVFTRKKVKVLMSLPGQFLSRQRCWLTTGITSGFIRREAYISTLLRR
jgi:hypothetical protein